MKQSEKCASKNQQVPNDFDNRSCSRVLLEPKEKKRRRCFKRKKRDKKTNESDFALNLEKPYKERKL
ncbi:unnamed protein product [Moneuplotes crassus]|uniref:Uncharacterized protein n=1 Tax=Euplotes crassus TaxID=5936 RepID=A0AAD1XAC4_EUPCR|nr:unnamed protein product [Moneuplotes crassus]